MASVGRRGTTSPSLGVVADRKGGDARDGLHVEVGRDPAASVRRSFCTPARNRPATLVSALPARTFQARRQPQDCRSDVSSPGGDRFGPPPSPGPLAQSRTRPSPERSAAFLPTGPTTIPRIPRDAQDRERSAPQRVVFLPKNEGSRPAVRVPIFPARLRAHQSTTTPPPPSPAGKGRGFKVIRLTLTGAGSNGKVANVAAWPPSTRPEYPANAPMTGSVDSPRRPPPPAREPASLLLCAGSPRLGAMEMPDATSPRCTARSFA